MVRPTDTRPQVTVVIPCHNAAPYLGDTLASLDAQTFDAFELILVDDASTDDSVSLTRAWSNAHPHRTVRVIEIEHSGHPATPRNVGIEAAAADLVLCLDADDQLTPPFLEACVTALAAEHGASIAYTDQQDFGASDAYHSVPEYDFPTLVNRNFLGICSVFRRQAWLEVGGFDPRSRYEDWNFWLACGAVGHLGVKVPGVHWRYRVRADGRYLSDDRVNDRAAKAQFVQRRPGLYSPMQQAWAQAVLDGNPLADTVRDTVGAIPEFPPDPAPDSISAIPSDLPLRTDASVTPSTRPTVSIIVPAYNLARYLPAALDSALAQRPHLDGPLEVLVIDDGSQDETPEVLARYGDRIRAVRQRNGGLRSAIDHGLRLATGEFIALLDADDTWPRDRLARHIRALRTHPSVGLVHGDMVVTNAHGDVIDPSFFSRPHMAPAQGRVLGALLGGNFVSGGACTFRASLLPALRPIPDDAAYPDWWIATCIAAVAEIRTVDGVANHYRQHGANMGLGAGAKEMPRVLRGELPWRRRLLADFTADATVTAAHLAHARSTFRYAIQTAASNAAGGAREVLRPDRAAAERILEHLPRAAVGAPRSKAMMRALAADPFDGALWLDLDRSLELEHRLGSLPPAPVLIDLLAAGPLTLAWHDELMRGPELLSAFAHATASDPETSLAILVEPTTDIARLVEATETNEAIAELTIDVVSAPRTPAAMALLASIADFCLTLRPLPAPYADLPRHPATERLRLPSTQERLVDA